MRFFVASACCIAVLAVACSPETRPLDWEYRFASSAQHAATATLEARILRGGCTSEEPEFATAFAVGATMGAVPSALSPGRWGFEVRAIDGVCVLIGEGCADVQLPSDEPRVLVLLDVVDVAPPLCEAAMCESGVCTRPDGGPPPERDARVPPGVDGGPITGVDGGPVTGVDAGPTTCGAGEQQCDGDPACERCPTAPRIAPVCYDGACVTGSCEPGFSDCDAMVGNGCETEGPCTCPPTGGCSITTQLGCHAVCDRDCTVRCGPCTTCVVDCASGATCFTYCSPGVLTSIPGRFTCELEDTC